MDLLVDAGLSPTTFRLSRARVPAIWADRTYVSPPGDGHRASVTRHLVEWLEWETLNRSISDEDLVGLYRLAERLKFKDLVTEIEPRLRVEPLTWLRYLALEPRERLIGKVQLPEVLFGLNRLKEVELVALLQRPEATREHHQQVVMTVSPSPELVKVVSIDRTWLIDQLNEENVDHLKPWLKALI